MSIMKPESQEATPSMTPGRQGELTFDGDGSDFAVDGVQSGGIDPLSFLLEDGAASNNTSGTSLDQASGSGAAVNSAVSNQNPPLNGGVMASEVSRQGHANKFDSAVGRGISAGGAGLAGGPVVIGGAMLEPNSLKEKHQEKMTNAVRDYGLAGGFVQGVKNAGDTIAHGVQGASNMILGHKGTSALGHGLQKGGKQLGEAMKKSPQLNTAEMAASPKSADPALEATAENNRDALTKKSLSLQGQASAGKSKQADKGGISL